MTANIQTITLDLTNSAYSAAQKVFVVQGDSGTRPVKAVITDNGMVRTDLSHESVCLYIDNNGDRPTYVEGISVVNGVAEFNIPQSAVLNAGTVRAELRFVDEENRVLTSVSFVVEVGASVYDENALLGTDDGDVLIRMVEQTRKSAAAAAESAAEAEKTADNLVGRVDAAIEELTDAKERGEFDGSDGISVTHQWDGTVLTVTSASGTSSADLKGEKGDTGATGSTGPRGEKGEKGEKGDKGEDGADYILTDDDKREIATKANAVSYSVTQDLTKEQKQMARTNIGAVSQAELADGLNEKVDASLVVSNIISNTGSLLSNNIPNGSAVADFIRNNSVSSAQTQSLTLSKKARARSNINAAEDAGTWELLYTIEGDGATNNWEFTKFADGSDLKLRAAAVKTINTVAASADTYGFIFAYDSSSNTISTAVIAKFLSKTAGAVALGIIEQDKGYYRAYAVEGASKNPGNVRYSGFQQYNEIGNIETTPYIPKIKVNNQTTAYLPVGSTIEVWGVKA